jgi:hypothetical protein
MRTFKVFTHLGDFHTLKAAREYINIQFRKHRICVRAKCKAKPDAIITYWRSGRRPSRVDRLYLDGLLTPLGGRFRVHGVIEIIERAEQGADSTCPRSG